MKTLFISVKIRKEPDYSRIKELVDEIPEKKIAICYSNQFIEIAEKVAETIDKEVLNKIQVLGCSSPNFDSNVKAILLIGQGEFHAVSLAYESKLPIYLLEGDNLRKIKEEEVEKLEKRRKGAYMKYLAAGNLGILISSKPGQQRLNKVIDFKKNLKDKKGYLFIANDLNVSEFENFGLDFWVNSACPRMDLNDAPIINMKDLDLRN